MIQFFLNIFIEIKNLSQEIHGNKNLKMINDVRLF